MGILDNFALPANVEAAGARQDVERMQFQSQDGVTTMSGFSEDGIPYRFFIDYVYNHGKSLEEGFEVYDEKESVEYFINHKTRHVEEIKFIKPERLARNLRGEIVGGSMFEAYQRWKEGKEVPGLKVDRWDVVSVGEARTLNNQRIYTVEQLAATPQDRIATMFNNNARFMEIYERAKVHVNTREISGKYKSLEAENAEIKKQLEELQALVTDDKSSKKSSKNKLVKELEG